MTVWIKATATRAIRTAAQSAIGAIGTATLITDLDWGGVVSIVAISTLLSVLTSLAGLPEAKSPIE